MGYSGLHLGLGLNHRRNFRFRDRVHRRRNHRGSGLQGLGLNHRMNLRV